MSLKELEQEGVKLEWTPWKMPDDANPPAKPEGYGEEAKHFLGELMDKTGINIKPPSKKCDTFLAHVGGKFAREYGKFTTYHQRIFKAVWEDDVDIEKEDVLAQLAAEVGLDSIQYKNALNNPTYKQLVKDDFRKAQENQIWTIPSYVGSKGVIQVHHFKDMPDIQALLEII